MTIMSWSIISRLSTLRNISLATPSPLELTFEIHLAMTIFAGRDCWPYLIRPDRAHHPNSSRGMTWTYSCRERFNDQHHPLIGCPHLVITDGSTHSHSRGFWGKNVCNVCSSFEMPTRRLSLESFTCVVTYGKRIGNGLCWQPYSEFLKPVGAHIRLFDHVRVRGLKQISAVICLPTLASLVSLDHFSVHPLLAPKNLGDTVTHKISVQHLSLVDDVAENPIHVCLPAIELHTPRISEVLALSPCTTVWSTSSACTGKI